MRQASDVTRRQFVGGVAAGSFAFPTIVPSTVFGTEAKAPPSERITVGFIGCGKMANDYHLPELLGFGDVQALAVCEVDAKRREHAKKRVEKAYSGKTDYKGCAAYADFRELIARKDIDAVCIATPEHWHAIPAIEAMKAGKDVYCEKPLTLTLAEGKRCIDAARKYKRVFQTGSQQRSNVFGDFREAVEIIRSGRLGKIQTVTVGVGGPSKWCDLPAEDDGAGPRLGPLARPRADAAVQLDPQPARRPQPLPRLARATASTPAADTPTWAPTTTTSPSGAWAWTTPAPSRSSRRSIPKRQHGVIYRYANGVVMIHGGPSGCTFTGTEGTLRIDRDHLTQRPGLDREGAARQERRPPGQVAGPPSQLARLHPLAEAAGGRRRDRRPLGGDHDPRQPRLLEPSPAPLGPEEVGVRRRRRGQQVARPRAPRSVAASQRLNCVWMPPRAPAGGQHAAGVRVYGPSDTYPCSPSGPVRRDPPFTRGCHRRGRADG